MDLWDSQQIYAADSYERKYSFKCFSCSYQPTPVLLSGKSHAWRSLVGCGPWGCEESDTTEWLHFHFSLSCIGEGNGNPLQCSCLENPRDGGAWWAAICGITQSQTRLKWLSSSSRNSSEFLTLDIVFFSSRISMWFFFIIAMYLLRFIDFLSIMNIFLLTHWAYVK